MKCKYFTICSRTVYFPFLNCFPLLYRWILFVFQPSGMVTGPHIMDDEPPFEEEELPQFTKWTIFFIIFSLLLSTLLGFLLNHYSWKFYSLSIDLFLLDMSLYTQIGKLFDCAYEILFNYVIIEILLKIFTICSYQIFMKLFEFFPKMSDVSNYRS